MLAVDHGDVIECFAGLKDLAISVAAEGQRLGAQHQIEGQRSAREGALRHAHPPVLRRQLVAAPRTALMVDGEKEDTVLHQVPRGRLRRGVMVLSGWRRRIGRLGLGRGRRSATKKPQDQTDDGPGHDSNH